MTIHLPRCKACDSPTDHVLQVVPRRPESTLPSGAVPLCLADQGAWEASPELRRAREQVAQKAEDDLDGIRAVMLRALSDWADRVQAERLAVGKVVSA